MSEALIHPQEEFSAHLEAGRFMLLRSRSSGAFHFFPRIAAPGSGARDLEWVEASGRGVVHARTTMRPKPPAAPYNVSLIDLAEGPRIMSRVEGVAPDAVRIGMAVQALIRQEADGPLLIFKVMDEPA